MSDSAIKANAGADAGADVLTDPFGDGASVAPARVSAIVCAVSRPEVLGRWLLASPDFAPQGNLPLHAHFGVGSAAEALNPHLALAGPDEWVLWVHQDVRLPAGWWTSFRQRLAQAQARWPHLAVAGVYGVAHDGSRAGAVLDRGHWLKEPTALPALVETVDELLLAVRGGTELQANPALGFDFYGADLALQAEAAGLATAVLRAPCEHGSDTPTDGRYPAALKARIARSGAMFEQRWPHRLPVHLSWMRVDRVGAVQALVDSLP